MGLINASLPHAGYDQTSYFKSMTVGFSDSHPTLYVVHKRAKPVLCGPNSTEPDLFHHGEITYRERGLSENAIVVRWKKYVWL